MNMELLLKIVKETDAIFFDERLRADVKKKGDADFVTRADCEISEYLHRRLSEEFPGVDIDAMWGHTRDFLEDYYSRNTVTVKKGLYELLEHLKGAGYKLAVASSTKKEKVEHHLQSADVRQYFDAVIGGDMVEKSKPEPDIYQTAAAALGVSPEECYALEDSRNGLLSAYRAGCKVIHVPDLWQPDDTVKSFILGPFEDLLAVRDWLIAQA